ncbi:hypothetical protein [Kribbella jiaozuonensis]|uniref:Uncharacterized protein n=1 Tax=Kribbella jiaozuonensis TaxID=2575441 RepID=A0A4U3M2E9_9ACTN|nr:hypothetical protein [Kribbella jiaozuonensis]TKK82821.1 hypothetical protein FDA38_08700 [Kribbella jiaozuonensis]
MTADDSHTALAGAWHDLSQILDSMHSRLQWSDTQYLDVSDKAERVRQLGSHLSSAVLLAERTRYSSAFALVRTGLEQVLVDWLVFLGRTFVQHQRGVDERTWEQWQADKAVGKAWTADIKEWTRTRKGEVRIVREGPFSEPDAAGRRQQVSIYYFLLRQYSPGLGSPAQQEGDGLIDVSELRELAKENDALWKTYLTWSSLLVNLQANDLVDPDDAGRLASHYRFLSGYTHPVADLLADTYGRNFTHDWPRFDHYSSELILLYALTLGTLEIRTFLRSLEMYPDISVEDTSEIQAALERAERCSSHFWFLGANPHAYDVWTARNAIVFRQLQTGDETEPPPELSPAEVSYPRDPLKRLVDMHNSAHEFVSGLVYTSPWPRVDARFR